jgi:anti-sigma B factor antagonist
MLQETPVDIVRLLWERFQRDGVDAALGLVDEDVVYLMQLEGGRVLRGAEQVRALFADVERQGVTLEARLDTLEGRGDAVIAGGSVRVHRPDGLEESQYHWVFHFAGGRLRRLSMYASLDEATAALAALNAIGPPPPEFAVGEREDGDLRIVRPAGELDIATAPRLERALLDGRGRGDRVVLDLADLEFIDSTGLRVIIRAVEAAERGGWDLRLRPGPTAVHRVFEIAGVIDALPFETP